MSELTLNQALQEDKKWLTRKGAAQFLNELGCPISTHRLAQLAVKNNSGKGPAFYIAGMRTVRYRPSDLRAWAKTRMRRVE